MINLSKAIVDKKLNVMSGHALSTILYDLCMNYSSYAIGTVKGKYDHQKVQKYVTERTQTEPKKIDNEHRLFMVMDLYANGISLEKIEEDCGIEPDSVPYVSGAVSQDFVLLGKLVRKQCMGDPGQLKFCELLEMCGSMMKRGIPYHGLPFAELIDRIGRKKAMAILRKYGTEREVLKALADQKRTEKEFREIEGIGKKLAQRIVEKRKNLFANLQRKIELWGTYNY